METSIGNIDNYYGGLMVKSGENIFFWGIEDHSGIRWEEIPKSLHDELIKYNESL